VTERLVIIGGGPAGLSAAKGYRDHGGAGEVVILSADAALPYNRPPLSKDFLQGEMPDSELGMEDQRFFDDSRIEVRLDALVTRLDPAAHLVQIAGSEPLTYTWCVLATGSSAQRITVDNAHLPGIHTLRSLADGRRLAQDAADAKRATVIGSGFIGCEVAASLSLLGVEVTLVTQEELPQQKRLGDYAGRRIADWLEGHGVELVLDSKLAAVGHDATTVHLDDREIEADFIVMAAGAAPNVELAEAAGLLMDGGRICTDSRMRTSAPDVYAVGDIAFAVNEVVNRRLPVEHWGEAMAMGEVAGTTIAGHDAAWAQAPGFWSSIGEHTLKYVAWGDGFTDIDVREHPDGGFTVWYSTDGVLVGALTSAADDDYERGRELIERGASVSDI
jgi:3-phenylpropionate/trans-cinnamate dioxygenase ferredoxin reductase subunit